MCLNVYQKHTICFAYDFSASYNNMCKNDDLVFRFFFSVEQHFIQFSGMSQSFNSISFLTSMFKV